MMTRKGIVTMLNSILKRLSFERDVTHSKLYNENTFYDAFIRDIKKCNCELIIESGFMTSFRTEQLLPMLQKLKKRGVRILINTRDPEGHSKPMISDARKAVSLLQHEGINVIYTKDQHRKNTVIDRGIVWEGSLNILSQRDSRELMSRTESVEMAWGLVRFINNQ